MDAFADSLKTSEMNDSIDFVLAENHTISFFVTHIDFVEFDMLSCDLFDSSERFFIGVAKVVHNYNVIALIEQFDYCVSSDEPCATCN